MILDCAAKLVGEEGVSVLFIALTLASDKQPYQLLRGYASPSYGLSLVVSQRNAVFTGVTP